MGDKRNYAALDWVIGEIGETLKDARQALEAHVENPRDTARIRFCLTHIHQVHGSLQMVEFHGASLFAEEMELLAEAIMHGTVSNENEAHEVLMRSLLQLPNYLEQVKTYQDDHPGTVLPLLNDLRAVRKQSLLSETNLFNPDLSSMGNKNGSRHAVLSSPAKLKQVLQKLLEMYQFAAAGVLRGVKVDENLAYIDKVFARLESISSGTASFPIWQVSSALVEALIRDDVELSVAVRVLLRHLARELRILVAHNASALDAPVREPLLRNLLYYVARAEDGGTRVAAVKAQYGLDRALLGGGAARSQQSRSMISAPEPDAVRAVVAALQDELNTVKHLLDLSLSGQGGLSDVEEMLPVVKRIADTLAVLGIGDLRKQAMDQYDALRRLCKTGDLSDTLLIDVAGRIADLEYRLEAIGRGAGKRADYATVNEREVEIDSAKEAVLTECRVGLDSVKEAIVESLSSQWDASHLPSAVAVLHHVQGGLAMVPLPRAVGIVERCSRYIDEQLTQRTSSPGAELQTLADAIASIDYYLERLVTGHNDDLDPYLEIAEESLQQLGYPVSKVDQPDQEPPALQVADEPGSESEPESVSEAQNIATEQPEDFQEEQNPQAEVALEPEVSDELSEPAEETLDEAAPEDEESDIDEEIIEIFVEEAAEVQQTLAEYFPKWRDNYDDSEALAEVRRAFHTLKGSGRMVEALDVGELAWSIENMLNRILENTVSPRTEHGLVIEHVLGLTPSLIEAFKQQAPNPDPEYWQRCIDWANDLANGVVPENLGQVSAHSEPVESADSADIEPEHSALTFNEVQEANDDDGDDQVLWDIFASEANSHLKVVDQFIRDMDSSAPLYGPPTDDLQRALHTLKGSAHMAAVIPIATMITPLELFVKELRSYQVKINEDILQLIKDTSAYTREGLDCIAAREPVELPKLEQFLARVEELRSVHIAPLVHMKEQDATQKQVDPRLLAIFMAEDMRLLLDADQILEQWQNNDAAEQQSLGPLITELQTLSEGAEQANLPEMSALSSELQSIHQTVRDTNPKLDQRFYSVMTQAHNALLDMVDAIAAGQNLQPVPEPLQTELNQVAADLMALPVGAESDELQWEVADDSDGQGDSEFSADDFAEADDLEFEASESELVSADADYFDPERPWLPHPEPIEQGVPAEQGAFDQSEGVGVASEDSAEAPDYFDPARPWLPYPEPAPELSQEFNDRETTDAEESTAPADDHEFAAEQLEAPEVSESTEESSLAEAEAADDGVAPEPLDLLLDPEQATLPVLDPDDQDASDTADDINALADPEQVLPASANNETWQLEDSATEVSDDDSEAIAPELEDQSEPTNEDALEWQPEPEAVDEFSAEAPRAPRTAPPVEDWPAAPAPLAPLDLSAMAEIDSEDFDPDILEIFLEEANELIEELDEAIHTWESDRDNIEAPETMKRALHTLKGGARLSGLKTLGQMVHEYESDLIGTSDINADPNFFPRIQQYQDVLLNGVRAVRAQLDGEAPPEPVAAPPSPPEQVQEQPEVQRSSALEELLAQREASAQHEQVEFSAPALTSESQPSETESVALATADGFVVARKADNDASGQQPSRRQGPQEMIKVSADLLEELVNLAGETSISRGRLEQQVNDLSTAVDEVDGTLRRMSEQLRRLDIETEAQVLFRREQMEQHEHFDPLEMDRYSQLQQLTRSLMESNSDLVDLKRTLSDKIKDTETLLLQQSRINSSLQEGLMRSRMVPFSRLVPRLRRIVRQVSAELGKQVNFELDNVEGEMDRSVLERMVAPLEHMLRNAVDHGVETPAQRAEQHKPETGRILLSLAREGGDILLRLADDGRGIDLTKVRAKAIDRGLMASDAELSDHDVMQFILQAGFSTAENVTQISGRGVGMDVVASEIKQLGGSMSIDSQSGVGTQFTVRLPFTVSVNRALMVQLGLESYAIPLNTIEGIVRVSPFELEHYYTHPEARFEYAGENYQVRHLGAILSPDLGPKLEGQMLPLPVILVRSGENTMALQVDGLMGSREIVVKSLGPQFAAVQGVSGATVMGDGSVVVIIDPHALVRREMALLANPRSTLSLGNDLPEVEAPEVHKTVMVVDDSVTVRKVTGRFLEREGYNVMTAKDGVDALQLLQEEIPDLMLLDIEMPRMDGFEVAKNIRSSSRLKHIPIIMITSRTGSKHREHALSIGVNDYVGKPYQEETLLKIMQGLLGTSPKA